MNKSDLEPLFVLRGHRAVVESLAFHQMPHILFSGDDNATLKIWDLETRRPMFSKLIFTTQSQIINILYLSILVI